ncbi:MAG: hypothetical protein NTV54_05910 [Ignavibacteriales bacterium]|nr:hypothetical protein [Ignavibacteriales bacterium]
MDSQLLARLQDLILQGEKLVPEGGLEFSGYNAKMQNQYLLWRKNCLDSVAKLGERGSLLRTRITNEENGAYFYQSSAQNVLDVVRETAELVESGVPTIQPPPKPPTPKTEPTKQEPPKAETPRQEPEKIPVPKQGPAKSEAPMEQKIEIEQHTAPPQPAQPQSVTVVSSEAHPLLSQLLSFLGDIGLQAVPFHRVQGSPSALVEHLKKSGSAPSAFYLFSGDDTLNEMFEIGHLVGKLGADKIFCIHFQQTPAPVSIPGMHDKEIVVKLEEISFSLIKELKAAGYTVSI